MKADISIILCIFLMANFIALGFCEEGRNPFKDWFPVIKIEPVTEEPVVEIEEVKVFDVSLYNLEGVVWGEYIPKAIINNKIYALGDKLDEAEITKIDKIGVTVKFDDEEYIIRTKNVTIEQKDEGVDNDQIKEK